MPWPPSQQARKSISARGDAHQGRLGRGGAIHGGDAELQAAPAQPLEQAHQISDRNRRVGVEIGEMPLEALLDVADRGQLRLGAPQHRLIARGRPQQRALGGEGVGRRIVAVTGQKDVDEPGSQTGELGQLGCRAAVGGEPRPAEIEQRAVLVEQDGADRDWPLGRRRARRGRVHSAAIAVWRWRRSQSVM
jgi:hypothetical protein